MKYPKCLFRRCICLYTCNVKFKQNINEMKTNISSIFLDVVKNEKCINNLILEVKKNREISNSEKYAYQAFCCAVLAKGSKSFLQKGEYIKKYGVYISKAVQLDKECYLSILIRNMVEEKLGDKVNYMSHQAEDTTFLENNINNQVDSSLREITIMHLTK